MKKFQLFVVKYWKMLVAVLGIVAGALLLRPNRSQKSSSFGGLVEAEDKIKQRQVDEQIAQADNVNKTINQINNEPKEVPKASDSSQSIDDIAKEYDKL